MTKQTKPIRRKKIVKEYNSVIISKVQFNYNEFADNGHLYVHFNSGLIYEFYNVKPRFVEAFMDSKDRDIGYSYNKYINNHFRVDKIIKSPRFTEMLEKSRLQDKTRKLKQKEKRNAKLVLK